MAGSKSYSADDMTLLRTKASIPASSTVDDSLYQAMSNEYATAFVVGNEVYSRSIQDIRDSVSLSYQCHTRTFRLHQRQVSNPGISVVVCSDRFGNIYPAESREGAKELRRMNTEKANNDLAKTMKHYCKRFKNEATSGEKPVADIFHAAPQQHEKTASEDLTVSDSASIHWSTTLESNPNTSLKASNAEVMDNIFAMLRNSATANGIEGAQCFIDMLRGGSNTAARPSVHEPSTQDFSLAAQIPAEADYTRASSSQDCFDFLAAFTKEKEKQASTTTQAASHSSLEHSRELISQPSPPSLGPVDVFTGNQSVSEGSSSQHSNPNPELLADEEELFTTSNAPIRVSLPGPAPLDSSDGSSCTSGQQLKQRAQVAVKTVRVEEQDAVKHSPTVSSVFGISWPSTTPTESENECCGSLDFNRASTSRLKSQLKERDLEVEALLEQLKEKDTEILKLKSELATYEMSGVYIGDKGVTNDYHEDFVKRREETLEHEKEVELKEIQEAYEEQLKTNETHFRKVEEEMTATISFLNKRWDKYLKETRKLKKQTMALTLEKKHMDNENFLIGKRLEEVERDLKSQTTDINSQNTDLIMRLEGEIFALQSPINNLLVKNQDHNRPEINSSHAQQQVQELQRRIEVVVARNNHLLEQIRIKDNENDQFLSWINSRVALTGAIDLVCNGGRGCTCASCHLHEVNELRDANATLERQMAELQQSNADLQANAIPLAYTCTNTPACHCQKCLYEFYQRIYWDKDLMIKHMGAVMDDMVFRLNETEKFVHEGLCTGDDKQCRCVDHVRRLLAVFDRIPHDQIAMGNEIARLNDVLARVQSRCVNLNNEAMDMKADLEGKLYGARFGDCFGIEGCTCLDCVKKVVDNLFAKEGKQSKSQPPQVD